MDVVKTKARKNLINKKNVSIFSISLVILLLLIFTKSTLNQVSIAKKELLFATVKNGDIDVTVEGYGKLASEKLQLITTLTRATVKEIRLKPGAKVSKESVIVKLANPELLQQVENAQQELAQINANLRQLKVNQQRELLDEESQLAELEALFETALLRRSAEEKLVSEGIVSQLAYKESVLNEKQLSRRIEILHKRVTQLSVVHKEGINIVLERIKQQQGKLNVAINRMEKLDVKAGFEGVLQKLSVTLGQSLSPGQEVALIGSMKELIALIRVPQSQVQHVVVGQKVEIDTRQDKIMGMVTRIDPIVADNTVEVEVSLPKSLPNSARPQQNVDAVITAKTLRNIKYIARPVNAVAKTITELYQINNAEDQATKVSIEFGEKTGKFIEIIRGADTDDRFVISDLSNYSNKEITLN
ncbi:HlyD family secretion protein [Cognaticolwellia mytili]|uniref:HlyD family secretion protein n=1 Tax=Cognaticolwellia mytili TaxID=1888913 RepID=UPI000A172404|nr:HlyD family efflux transporter periplasmic adaptor subunit [Cognaticolwellia mytili]